MKKLWVLCLGLAWAIWLVAVLEAEAASSASAPQAPLVDAPVRNEICAIRDFRTFVEKFMKQTQDEQLQCVNVPLTISLSREEKKINDQSALRQYLESNKIVMDWPDMKLASGEVSAPFIAPMNPDGVSYIEAEKIGYVFNEENGAVKLSLTLGGTSPIEDRTFKYVNGSWLIVGLSAELLCMEGDCMDEESETENAQEANGLELNNNGNDGEAQWRQEVKTLTERINVVQMEMEKINKEAKDKIDSLDREMKNVGDKAMRGLLSSRESIDFDNKARQQMDEVSARTQREISRLNSELTPLIARYNDLASKINTEVDKRQREETERRHELARKEAETRMSDMRIPFDDDMVNKIAQICLPKLKTEMRQAGITKYRWHRSFQNQNVPLHIQWGMLDHAPYGFDPEDANKWGLQSRFISFGHKYKPGDIVDFSNLLQVYGNSGSGWRNAEYECIVNCYTGEIDQFFLYLGDYGNNLGKEEVL